MGAGQSTSQAEAPTRGLHVLRVTPSSPAFHANIEPFFDFIVGFEGDSLSSDAIDASALEKIVESHENRTLNLLVWSSKNKQTRTVSIIPSRVWSQQSSSPDGLHQSSTDAQPSLLGLSMRICQLEMAADNVWHVLDVLEGSPAESAGLVPMGDWILGWSGGVLSAENDFYDLVDAHVDKPLRVYVYSYDFDTLREVVLIPNRHWGGEGLLGCVFGFGLLHRIPPQPEGHFTGTLTAEIPEGGDEYGTQDLFIPADVDTEEGPHSSSQLAKWRRSEQEQWNRELQARSAHPASQPVSKGVHDHSHEQNRQSYESSHITEATPRANAHDMNHIPPMNISPAPAQSLSPPRPVLNGSNSSAQS